MKRWGTYLKERSPLAALLPVALGPTLSAMAFDGVRFAYSGALLAAGTVLLLGFLVLARLMDEVKDFDKDRLAHPERPLARGLLSVPEVERAIRWLTLKLLVVGIALAAAARAWPALDLASPLAGLLFALSIAYLWLMYREFYIGRQLANYPMLYALSHQLVVVPLYLFPIAYLYGSEALGLRGVGYCFMNIAAAMTFEVGRKLDPAAHPALKTYRAIYGHPTTVGVLVAFMALTLVLAFALGLLSVMLPTVALTAVAVLVYARHPERFKAVEATGALNVIVALHSLWIAVVVQGGAR